MDGYSPPASYRPNGETEIAQRFNALRTSDSQPLSDFLRFRAARRLGANAFALHLPGRSS